MSRKRIFVRKPKYLISKLKLKQQVTKNFDIKVLNGVAMNTLLAKGKV